MTTPDWPEREALTHEGTLKLAHAAYVLALERRYAIAVAALRDLDVNYDHQLSAQLTISHARKQCPPLPEKTT